MIHFKVFFRLFLFLITTVYYYAALLLVRLIFSSKGRRPWERRVIKGWALRCGAILGMRPTIDGHAPSPPFLLVSNHLSYVDILLILGHTDLVFVAKSEVRSWPLLGFLARSVNTLFIDREKRRDLLRVNQLIAEAVAAQKGVVLFPEGTTSKGDQILPFKPSLLNYAASTNSPTYYCTLSYRTPAGFASAQEAVCWWDDSPFFYHLLKLLRLPYFEATLSFGKAPIVNPDRKGLAQALWLEMDRQFTPLGPPFDD